MQIVLKHVLYNYKDIFASARITTFIIYLPCATIDYSNKEGKYELL